MIRLDKRGAVDADFAPILLRLGANPGTWLETISHFGSRFCLAAGLLCDLCHFADQLGRRLLKGVAAAETQEETQDTHIFLPFSWHICGLRR